MGGSKTTTNNYEQQQTSAPPSWTMPGIAETANKVTQALATLPGQRYEGNFNAILDPTLANAATSAYTSAAGKSGELSNFVQSMLPQLGAKAPTSTYDLGANADTSGVIDAAINPVFRQLTQQILPGIKSSSIASGAYSGDRATMLLPQLAIRDSNEAAQRIASEISYKDYTDREARRLSAYQTDTTNALNAYGLETSRLGQIPGFTDNIMKLAASNGDLLAQAMGIKSMQEQSVIDDALARDSYNLEFPFRGLDIATSLLSQLSGGWGTTSGSGSSVTTEKTGGLGPIVQGLAGLASAGLGLATGGLGSAAGAAAKGASGIVMGANRTIPTAASVFGGG